MPHPPLMFLLLFLSFYTLTSGKETEVQALLAWRSSLKDPGCLTQIWPYNVSSDPCHWHGIKCNEAGSIANLSIVDCSIDGTLNKFNFSSFPNLTMLHIEMNTFLQGKIPKDIGSLPNLHVLNLYGNNLTGEIPSTISNLSSLKNLNLSNNYITGAIPSTIQNMSNLQCLDLHQNMLTGEIPAQLETYPI